ncbi:MAG: ATP-binding protein, partial [Chitinophagaceae bacterium]
LLVSFSLIFGILQYKKRESTEKFLASVLNTSLNGIISYKAIRSKDGGINDFKIIYANDEIESHNGKKPADIIGKNYKDVFPLTTSNGDFDRQMKALDSGDVDIFEIMDDDENREGWFKVKLARNGDGITSSFINISDIKKFEKQLKIKILQLEQSNHELEQFAYVASHDLQEPLRKIQTFADLVLKRNNDKFDKPTSEYLHRIIQSANRMSRLINDVLNYSKLAKSGESLENTDLNQLLGDVLIDLELMLEQKKGQVHVETLPIVEAYPLQMTQLLYNLLNNSLKFVKEDIPPVVQINSVPLSIEQVRRFPQLDSRLTYIEIQVKDNGIGFSPEYANQIFTIFNRLHTGSSYSGSGIGLALCKKIAVNHHGDIFATAAVNEGSTFHILLPLKQPELSIIDV